MTEAPFMVGDIFTTKGTVCPCKGVILALSEEFCDYKLLPCDFHEYYKDRQYATPITNLLIHGINLEDPFDRWVKQTRREAGIHD